MFYHLSFRLQLGLGFVEVPRDIIITRERVRELGQHFTPGEKVVKRGFITSIFRDDLFCVTHLI